MGAPRGPGRGERRRMPVWAWVGIGAGGCLVLLSCGGIFAAIAIPNLLRARIATNEIAVIEAMATLRAAQNAAKGQAAKDTDGDGVGEFLSLSELEEFDASVLSLGLSSGVHHGFRFQVAVAPDGSTWHALAVPSEYRLTGMRVFYVDETSLVRAQDTGSNAFPDPKVASQFAPLGN